MPLVSGKGRGKRRQSRILLVCGAEASGLLVYMPSKYLFLSLPLWLERGKKNDRDWPSDTVTFMYGYVDAKKNCRMSHYSPGTNRRDVEVPGNKPRT